MNTRILAACATALAMAACSNSLAPFEPEIANVTDSFQFQVTGTQNLTTTREYTWQNTGTTANVNQASAVTAGSATLTILDSQGAQVYSKNLADNGTFQTSTGVAGEWKIRIAFSDLHGTINFRVQKP